METVRTDVSFGESFRTWLRISLLSFGGPAAQIAVMHRIIVDEKKWLEERRFLHALNFCMFLPGPEAQQLATYIGWLMHGVRGGLMAGLLFILPGFVSILALSYAYVLLQGTSTFEGLFFGLKCAVLAIVAEAVQRVSRRVLKNRALVLISIIASLLLWSSLLPFPAVIGLAALTGWLGHRFAPEIFLPKKKEEPSAPATVEATASKHVGWTRPLLTSAIFLTLWFAPIIALRTTRGDNDVFVQTSLFFSKAAVVTFGGAYSVLSYVDQQAVERFHWIEKGEMADGLGLAETTPGPLIMVVQFVGFLAAYRHATGLSPMMAGTVGAVLTTWVTFVPCFFWIFLGAPYVEKLLNVRSLSSALTGITASVVGVIATLGVNLAIATLFAKSGRVLYGPFEVLAPQWSTVNPSAVFVTTIAFVLTFAFHRGLAVTLSTCVIIGALLRWLL